VVTRISRFSVSHDHQRTWLLHIRGAQPEDAGHYMCQVNSDPMVSQVGTVYVVVPPSFIDSESSPSQLSVRENSRVSLICRGHGVPPPRLNWKREDGRSFIEGHSLARQPPAKPTDPGRMIISQGGEELIFTKISRTDSAAYLCIASNGIPPSVSKRIILDVEFEPMMFVPSQLLGSPLGGMVTLECVTEAQPRPITYWIQTDANNVNGVMLLPSKRIKPEVLHIGYQTQMRLHILKLEAQDIGHYKCVSKNSLGEAEGSIRLYEMMMTLPPTKHLDVGPTVSTTTVSATSTGKSRIFNDDGTPAESFSGDNIAYTEQREPSVYEDEAAGKQNLNDRDKNHIQRDNLRSSKGKTVESGSMGVLSWLWLVSSLVFFNVFLT